MTSYVLVKHDFYFRRDIVCLVLPARSAWGNGAGCRDLGIEAKLDLEGRFVSMGSQTAVVPAVCSWAETAVLTDRYDKTAFCFRAHPFLTHHYSLSRQRRKTGR